MTLMPISDFRTDTCLATVESYKGVEALELFPTEVVDHVASAAGSWNGAAEEMLHLLRRRGLRLRV